MSLPAKWEPTVKEKKVFDPENVKFSKWYLDNVIRRVEKDWANHASKQALTLEKIAKGT